MEVRSRDAATPFTTVDGSIIRSLLDRSNAPVAHHSLAEATLAPGQATVRHHHRVSEEIYYLVEGAGRMDVDGEIREVAVGDAILIPPGAWHQLTNTGGGPLRLLCTCAPAYRHEDTFFA